ncbi:MAG: CPBP family glutamic-type intramembrane protease [Pseudomonadota bacterium]
MLFDPTDETTAAGKLRAQEVRGGLFAWGLPALTGGGRLIVWLECVILFFALPLAVAVSGAALFIPFAISTMLCSCVALLSMTRNFHWGDLRPVDPLSEWRLVAGMSVGFAGLSAVASLIAERPIDVAAAAPLAPMLIAFPLLTAAPMELVQRALFFRRFGRLFPSESVALVYGAASNALLYFMLTGTNASLFFGAFIGVALGWAYLRTGQFLISVLLHWIAAICIFTIGPGLLFI